MFEAGSIMLHIYYSMDCISYDDYNLSKYWVRSGRPSLSPFLFLVS